MTKLRTNDKSKCLAFDSRDTAHSFCSQSEGGIMRYTDRTKSWFVLCNPPHYEYFGPKSMGVKLYDKEDK